MMERFSAIHVLWMAAVLAAAPLFTARPTETPDGNRVRISFAVSEYAVTTVEVIDSAGRVIRSLGSGLLGPKAPLPFQANALSQAIYWDKTDDNGRTWSGSYDIKVGLGLIAAFDRIYGLPHDQHFVRGSIRSVACDTAGNVYCLYYGSAFDGGIVAYNKKGEYLRTVFPYPSSLPEDQLKGFGRFTRPDGKKVPTIYQGNSATFMPGIFCPRKQGMAITAQGWILTVNGVTPPEGGRPMPANRVVLTSIDGSCPLDFCLGPLLNPDSNDTCYYLAASPDGKYVYASGDGPHVYRALLATTAQAPRFIDSGLIEPRGIATDGAGRLYVCDWGANQIRIYDTSGVFLKSVAVTRPEAIRVHRKNGQLYVLSRTETRVVTNYKFGAYPVCDSIFAQAGGSTTMTALDDASTPPVLYVGSGSTVVQGASDQGTSFKYVGFDTPVLTARRGSGWLNGNFCPGFIAVDPDDRVLYAGNDRFTRVNLETGVMTPSKIRAHELAYGPDGSLYAFGLGMAAGNGHDSTLGRYNAAESLIAFPNGKTVITGPYGYNQSISWATRGFGVRENGDFYFLHTTSRVPNCAVDAKYNMHVTLYDSLFNLEDSMLADVPTAAGGIRFDRAGNLFVGYNCYPRQMPWPGGFEAFTADLSAYSGFNYYRYQVGSLFKFGSAGGHIRAVHRSSSTIPTGHLDSDTVPEFQVNGLGDRTTVNRDSTVYSVKGALWQHFGLSPIPSNLASRPDGYAMQCLCLTPRFSVDGHGRVFLPDAFTFSCAVLDNNKNELLRFGEYGNPDQTGPGSLVPSPEIPLSFPVFVAQRRNHVYVSDLHAGRIVRVRLDYREWATTGGHSSRETAGTLNGQPEPAYPNPFNPFVNLVLNLQASQRVRIAIHGPDGRCVRVLCDREFDQGKRVFTWSGTDSRERRVASGIYAARIETPAGVKVQRLLLLK